MKLQTVSAAVQKEKLTTENTEKKEFLQNSVSSVVKLLILATFGFFLRLGTYVVCGFFKSTQPYRMADAVFKAELTFFEPC